MLFVAQRERVGCIIVGGDIIPHAFSGASHMGILSTQAAYLRDIFIPAIKDFKQRRDLPVYLDLSMMILWVTGKSLRNTKVCVWSGWCISPDTG